MVTIKTKIFSLLIILPLMFTVLSCNNVSEPTSPIVGVWEDVADTEHCIVFGNKGDYVNVIRGQGDSYATVLDKGVYYYSGKEIIMVDPLSKEGTISQIELSNGILNIWNETETHDYVRGDTRGLLLDI